MAHLVQVHPSDLSEQELNWLDKYSSWSYDGTTFRELIIEAVDGDLALWRISSSPAKGIIGTRLRTGRNGVQLWIDLLVGEGLLGEAVSIREAIHALGRRAQVSSIAGLAIRPGLARLYEKVLGVKPSATLFREEL